MQTNEVPPASRGFRLTRSLITPRAFEGARWAYWLLAALGACALILPLPAVVKPAFGSSVLTIALMASLWEAHARKRMPGPSSNPMLRFVCTIVGLCLWTVVFAIPLLIVTPACGCQDYGPRARISETILAASSVKTTISERYQVTESLHGSGHGLSVPQGPRIASSTVSEDGIIIVASSDPPAVITLTPEVIKYGDSSRLQWSCLGQPEKVMPASCRR